MPRKAKNRIETTDYETRTTKVVLEDEVALTLTRAFDADAVRIANPKKDLGAGGLTTYIAPAVHDIPIDLLDEALDVLREYE